MSTSFRSENLRVDNQNPVDNNELPHFDPRKAEENLSLYCKPIQLYNIIRWRNLKNVSDYCMSRFYVFKGIRIHNGNSEMHYPISW